MYYDRVVEIERGLSEEKRSFAENMAKGLAALCVKNIETTAETDDLLIKCADNIYAFITALYFGDERIVERVERKLSEMGQEECGYFTPVLPEELVTRAQWEKEYEKERETEANIPKLMKYGTKKEDKKDEGTEV